MGIHGSEAPALVFLRRQLGSKPRHLPSLCALPSPVCASSRRFATCSPCCGPLWRRKKAPRAQRFRQRRLAGRGVFRISPQVVLPQCHIRVHVGMATCWNGMGIDGSLAGESRLAPTQVWPRPCFRRRVVSLVGFDRVAINQGFSVPRVLSPP